MPTYERTERNDPGNFGDEAQQVADFLEQRQPERDSRANPENPPVPDAPATWTTSR